MLLFAVVVVVGGRREEGGGSLGVGLLPSCGSCRQVIEKSVKLLHRHAEQRRDVESSGVKHLETFVNLRTYTPGLPLTFCIYLPVFSSLIALIVASRLFPLR